MGRDFSEGKVSSNILAQAIPLIIAELVQLLYNVVDRIFIGHMPGIGSLALTGVGVVFPVVSIVGAFTSLFGQGGSPLFAIARGAHQDDEASRIQNNVFALLLGSSILLMLGCILAAKPILYLFGASDESYPLAHAYMRIYMLGTPFTMLAVGLNGFINAQGFPKVGMMTTVIGAVINLILDPLFIFVLNMGVEGAALATIISQFISCAWVLRFLTSKKPLFPLRRDHMKIEWPRLKRILSLGIVGFIMKATNSLVQAAANSTLQTYGGDLYVGIMTCINSVREILTLPPHGLTNGAQPVIGFNYGAKQYKRVRESIKFMVLTAIAMTAVCWACVIAFPRALLSIFSSDPATLDAGVSALLIYFVGFVFQALQLSGQATFQALGDAKHAVFFSLLRKVVIVTPLTLLLPRLGLGVNGVFLAEPISNIVGGTAVMTTMLLTVYRRLKKEESAAAQKESA